MRRNSIHALGALAILSTCLFADDADKARSLIKASAIRKHQTYLASDELEGRESGAESGHKAALYIMEQIRKYGLKPGGPEGSYFQGFAVQGRGAPTTGAVEEANSLSIAKDAKTANTYAMNSGMIPHRESRTGVVAAPVVFAGYGLKDAAYDDYSVAKVKDAIALVLDHGPREKEDKIKATVEQKVDGARKNGALALLIALGPLHHEDREIPRNDDFKWPSESKEPKFPIPVVYISREVAEALAALGGCKDLKAAQEEIDKTLKPKTWKTSKTVKVSVSAVGLPGVGFKNVIGVWPGTDEKLKDEYVVIGAHYDHVGRGLWGSNGGKSGEIHNGADDNASGTSAVLNIAEAVSQCAFRRTILLMWFDAEERGLFGSRFWTDNPTMPLSGCVAMINCDMVGRNDIKKILCSVQKKDGEPLYPKWVAVVRDAEKRYGASFDWNGADELVMRSDQWNFMQKGIPSVFFTGGLHPDYHTERDVMDKINFPKEELIGKIVFSMAAKCADGSGTYK